MLYLLMGLCLFFDIIYIVCKDRDKNIIGLFAKVLAAFCFITIGYLAYRNNELKFNYYVLAGLVFDGIGDLFLALRNIFAKNVTFLLGTISFLIGHIIFVRALLLVENIYLLESILLAIVIGCALFFVLSNVCRFSKYLKLIGIVYSIMLVMIVSFNMSIYFTNRTIKNLAFMIGSVLFISSDIILVLYNFSKRRKWMHPVYSLLYFVAQILISFSLHL